MKMVFAVMNTTNERNSEIQACTACDHCDTGSVPYQLSHCYDGGS